jgi:hypothetical protein
MDSAGVPVGALNHTRVGSVWQSLAAITSAGTISSNGESPQMQMIIEVSPKKGKKENDRNVGNVKKGNKVGIKKKQV